MILSFILNGAPAQTEAYPHVDLMTTLRDRCGITSIRRGAIQQNSGLSMILMDGLPVPSVLIPSFHAEGSDIITYEGVASSEEYHEIVQSFSRSNILINPLALPTLILLTYWIITENRMIPESEVRELLGEIACRGGVTSRILHAVQQAHQYRRIRMQHE
ncbi:2Fe-2S iron-sulfur cluster-binding protein [Spirochaeta africana]|uniref:Aerobic-type carbon monoxide dehydrogenase, small subunit CoxS/CutS-like protein n=1 Tax=Spirochaeta africana (strain ATCC 700263 / DSM 8902 / Z-7692) TaxID=889378 RepID=H9UL66_SPIAZ|nr:2Fe-2S iron-sulfur cluster-binding protein [Spirochaeta africana]AFG38259.1 aerobic-type carbon monoxide dehydrogenase, small subunit CoxS/CutS-like protein [Spirochaeta africana DSM 8902]